MGERKKGKKIGQRIKEEEKGRKKVNRSTNVGQYPYFLTLVYLSPYDRQKKVRKKNRKEFQTFSKGGGKIFLGGHNIYPSMQY